MGQALLLANSGILIVGGIVAVILIAVTAYYGARFMKGSLKLELSRDAASSGEFLTGKIDLVAKKPIYGLLKVSLVGRDKRTKRRSGSDSNTTEWVEVFREDVILEETRDFEAGFTEQYAFELVAPSASEARTGGAALRAISKAAGDGLLGGALSVAASAADMMQGRIYWHIETRLDADGVDLYDKEKCRVNLRD